MKPFSDPSLIALLTDFGWSDGYVGVMKGVILGIAPHVRIVDISHEIEPQQISSAAWVLASSYRYFPQGTIFVCVIDPGVGSTRRPIALQAGTWSFVGPDNGLFSSVLTEQTVHNAVALTNSAYHLAQVSATFQGRDIFSPAAAHLANGVSLEELGEQIDPSALLHRDLGAPVLEGERIHGQIVHVDHFGNLITNIPEKMFPHLFSGPGGVLLFPEQGHRVLERRRFFSEGTDGTTPFMYVDSSGYLGVAIQNGNVAKVLKAGYGSSIVFVIGEN